MISYDKIEKHSLTCDKVVNDVLVMDKCEAIQQLNYKIEKMGKVLRETERSAHKGEKDEHYIISLVQYAKQLLECEDYDRATVTKC